MFRTLLLALPLSLLACTGSGKDDRSDTGSTDGDACELAADSQTCPECSSGDATCTFEETSVTAASCGDCQARAGLYQQLCDDGATADRATIEAETVCESVQTDACALAEENSACDECFDGEVTCTYGDVSATENSCAGCQARSALYRDLCDSGIMDDRSDIEAGVVCE
jgi:hypothetical protein